MGWTRPPSLTELEPKACRSSLRRGTHSLGRLVSLAKAEQQGSARVSNWRQPIPPQSRLLALGFPTSAMTGATAATPMDVDAAAPPAPTAGAAAKGKAPLNAPGRAAPWVEKYRPQSLADVAAHRDIVDTSKWPRLLRSPDRCLVRALGFYRGYSTGFW